MYETPHHETRPAGHLNTGRTALGYSEALSAEVAELRNRLRGETARLLDASSARRRADLDRLMGELHERLASEQLARQEQGQARAAAMAAERDDRRTEVMQQLARDAELRESRARAERSMRRACSLARAAQLAALREGVQQMTAETREQAERMRNQLAARARQDSSDREAFMESMREQVTAMAEAFRASHLARCMESAERRRGFRAMIHDFVSRLTGRTETGREAEHASAQTQSEPASQPPQ